MGCGKPPGDPAAISAAADAIIRYADGIDGIFDPVDQTWEGALPSGRHVLSTVRLDVFWTGEAADSAAETLTEFRVQLNGYSDQLRTYAESLHEYARKLQESQTCTVWEVLVWVFMVVFTVIEIIIGLFIGGLIESFFIAMFEVVATALMETFAAVVEIATVAIESSAIFTEIAATIVEGAAVLGIDIGEIASTIGIAAEVGTTAAEIGGSGARVGTTAVGDAMGVAIDGGAEFAEVGFGLAEGSFGLAEGGLDFLEAGVGFAEGGFDAIGLAGRAGFSVGDMGVEGAEISANVLAEVTQIMDTGFSTIIDQVGTKLANLLTELPGAAFENSVMFGYKAVFNTAEWYFEEVIQRAVEMIDPRSGSFASKWIAEDEKAEVLAIFAGMAMGSMGFAMSDAVLGVMNGVLRKLGIDITKSLNTISTSWATALRGAKTEARGVFDDIDDKFRSLGGSFENEEFWANLLRPFAGGADDITESTFTTLESRLSSEMGDTTIGSLSSGERLSVNDLVRMRQDGELRGLGDIIEKEAPGSGALDAVHVGDETSTELIKDVFNDVLENLWDYGTILALYPPIRGEDFDFKEWWWYVTYGVVEGFLHAPMKHAATKITNSYFRRLFPGASDRMPTKEEIETFKENHELLGEMAKNFGDVSFVAGASGLRKVALDPLMEIGSFSEYLEALHEMELEEAELEGPEVPVAQ